MQRTRIAPALIFLLTMGPFATQISHSQTAANSVSTPNAVSASHGAPFVRLEKTKFALGEEVFFWVGVNKVGHAPIPKEYWNTCRLTIKRPDGTVKTERVGWPIDGPAGAGWAGGGGLSERPKVGRYTLEMQFAGQKGEARSFDVVDVPLLRQIKAEWVFGRQSDNTERTDIPVTLTIHNGSNQVIRFPHRNRNYSVVVSLNKLDRSSSSFYAYPGDGLLDKDEDGQPGAQEDVFTWDAAKRIVTITLKPGETYRQQLSVRAAVEEDSKLSAVAAGKYNVGFYTTLSVLVGEADGPFADLAPVRISVDGSTTYNVEQQLPEQHQ